MRLPNLSLRLSLILYVLLPVLLAVGALSYVALRGFERQVEGRMEEDVQLVARAIRYPVGQALAQNQVLSLQDALKSAFSIHRVYGAYVYDAMGTPVASIGRLDPGPQEPGLMLEMIREEQGRGEYIDIAGQQFYSYIIPITTTAGYPVGMLQITRRASDMRTSIARLRFHAGVFLLVVVLLIAGLVLFGHRRAVGTHLNRLRETMGAVREGARDRRVQLEGPREIVELGRTFNNMLDSIAEAEEEIRRRRAEQLALEKQLRHAEKLAAIGRLSAGIAHELGTPLSIIDGKAQQALRQDELPDGLNERFEDVREEVKRMEGIISQLLDFGRRHEVERRSVDPAQIVQMATDAVQPAARRSNVALMSGGPELDTCFRVDPTLMERALTNLIRNAIDVAPEGRVRVSWFVHEQTVGFTVEDDGPGVSEEEADRLFEPFYTTKDIGEGTGLGLAVVHGIVEEHGGAIAVEGSAWGGACFRISLPLDDTSTDTKNKQQNV